MKTIQTTDYYIYESELKQIIAEWFKEHHGKDVATCNILVKAKHTPYCEPEFDCVNINIEEEIR
jgi:hypothetical protein